MIVHCRDVQTVVTQTYVVTPNKDALNGHAITCLRCKRTSFNPNDVEFHYCGWCCVFHDDLWPPCRAWWLKQLRHRSLPVMGLATPLFSQVVPSSMPLPMPLELVMPLVRRSALTYEVGESSSLSIKIPDQPVHLILGGDVFTVSLTHSLSP